MNALEFALAWERSPEAELASRLQYAKAHDAWAERQLVYMGAHRVYNAVGASHYAKRVFDAYMAELRDPLPKDLP